MDPNSDVLIASIGADANLHPDFGADYNGDPFGIPYLVVDGSVPAGPVSFAYADESDPGPYPIPPDAPIEGGPSGSGDRHVRVIEWDRWLLFELFRAYPAGEGWQAGSGAIFDLTTNTQRPAGWTSADAAGLPVFPGLVRYDEVVEQAEIRDAIRFTRLKAGVDINGYPASVRVVLQALKTYGMILADNGSNWFISGAPDARWNDAELNSLKRIRGSDIEVVAMGPVITD